MVKFILSMLITLSTSSFAQNYIAKEILDRVNTTNQSYENISIEFDLFLENKSQNTKEYQQGFLFLENEKFYLTLNNQTIINNGETQWIYLSDLNELQIITPNPEDNIISPNKLFAIYEKDYNLTYVSNYIENEEKLHNIDLFPKRSQEFIKINITINERKNQLTEISIHDKNGGTYTYLIKSFQPNTKSKEFTFNIHDFPNIEVIDLR